MANEKREPFYITPRQIGADLRSGALTPDEWKVYMYIRQFGNPYGIAAISLENIRNDLYKSRKRPSVSYFNRIVLSLKSKRYIYFKERRGRRGSFEVHLGDWVLPDKTIKTLDAFFGHDQVRGEGTGEVRTRSEVSQNLNPASQRSKERTEPIFEASIFDWPRGLVRGAKNDNDTDKENEKYVNRNKMSLKEEQLTPVVTFIPNNSNEQRCQSIANELGEKNMNPILAILRNHGMRIIEDAWGISREDVKTKKIKNKGAYFQGIVKQIVLRNSS